MPDSSLNAAFFVTPGDVVGATVETVRSFDLTQFTPVGAVGIAAGPAKRVIRWGSDGLAFLTSAGEVVLLHLSSLSSHPPSTAPRAAGASGGDRRLRRECAVRAPGPPWGTLWVVTLAWGSLFCAGCE